MRGRLADAISHGLMDEPVQIHSHGGRVKLLRDGELNIDVAFLGVPCSDAFGNANGTHGKSCCGSLGYAMVDAHFARKVVLLTEELVPFPNMPASPVQDRWTTSCRWRAWATRRKSASARRASPATRAS